MIDAPKVYLRVTAHGDTFRRAGFVFTKATQVIACSPEQAKLIWAENGKQLKVNEASERDMHGAAKSDAELLAEASAANDSLAAKLDASLARIAELEAALASARADLEAATAPPSAPSPAPEAKPAPKPSKG